MVCVLAWMRHTPPWTTAIQLFRAMFQLNNGSWDFSSSSTSKGLRCPYKKEIHVMSRRIVANSEYLCASFILCTIGPLLGRAKHAYGKCATPLVQSNYLSWELWRLTIMEEIDLKSQSMPNTSVFLKWRERPPGILAGLNHNGQPSKESFLYSVWEAAAS